MKCQPSRENLAGREPGAARLTGAVTKGGRYYPRRQPGYQVLSIQPQRGGRTHHSRPELLSPLRGLAPDQYLNPGLAPGANTCRASGALEARQFLFESVNFPATDTGVCSQPLGVRLK